MMLAAVVAASVMAVWWSVEGTYRRLHRPPPSDDRDQGSAYVWDIAHVIQVIGVMLGFSGHGAMALSASTWGTVVSACGVMLLFAGIAIRWIAIATLGKLFTGRVLIQQGHHLIRSGIYARVRHPAYSGSLLAHVGIGLAFMNWWTLACSVLPYVIAVVYRIHIEERALANTFATEYAEYAHETKRLVPWVY